MLLKYTRLKVTYINSMKLKKRGKRKKWKFYSYNKAMGLLRLTNVFIIKNG